MTRKIAYVLQTRDAESRPRVTISKTSDGTITYSLTATGSSLAVARDRAQREFKGLTAFVQGLQSKAKS